MASVQAGGKELIGLGREIDGERGGQRKDGGSARGNSSLARTLPAGFHEGDWPISALTVAPSLRVPERAPGRLAGNGRLQSCRWAEVKVSSAMSGRTGARLFV